MKKNTTIRLELPSERLAKIMLKALLPETKKKVTPRSKVYVKEEGKNLIIQVEADDTSALRAAVNSYLRWVALVKDTYEATISVEK